MTYSENRSSFIARLKANRGQYNLALCPEPGLEDFYIFQDYLTNEKFIVHRREIDDESHPV
jgi:hypothetical protein